MRTTMVALAAAAALVAAAAGALAAPTNRYQTENTVEPTTAADNEKVPGTDRTYNGFADAGDHDDNGHDNEWDMVLDQVVTNDELSLVEPNTVHRLLLTEGGQAGLDADGDDRKDAEERYILPGAASSDLRWGWWRDKGSGGYMRETGFGGDSPDGVIDDGWDDGRTAVHFEDAASECPPTDPTCWQATGTWDEFIWRGGNNQVKNDNLGHVDTSQVDPDDPNITHQPNDTAYGFVQPGTHSSWENTVVGKEGTGHPVATPGYGVVSEGRDQPKQPDFRYQNWRGGQAWAGPIFVPVDSSLLISTEVTAAVNPADLGSGLKKDPADSTARDVDVYSAVSPAVETLYRTAVWDPGDEEHTADGINSATGNDHDEGEGAKARLKHFYSNDYPDTYRTLADRLNELLQPSSDVTGLADDYAAGLGSPYKHEPNHPEDDLPGASHDGGADYPGQLGDGPYYQPGQDWSGYAGEEMAFADFTNSYILYVGTGQLSGAYQLGMNADSPGTQDEQGTQGPGFLGHFGRVGTWWDVNGDTWVGDIEEEGRCSAQEEEGPYCSGNDDQPQDYTHNPDRFTDDDTTPEWRGTCQADVQVTFTPLTDVTNATGAPAWGTTKPPVGVYRYPTYHEESGIDLENPGASAGNYESRHVQYGNVSFGVGCDQSDAANGQWFPNDMLVLPTGTLNYPIRMEATVEVTEDRVDRASTDGSSITKNNATDVDVIHAWT